MYVHIYNKFIVQWIYRTWKYMYSHIYEGHIYTCIPTYTHTYTVLILTHYGVATMSRLLKVIGLFCRISSLLQGCFAKETYNFKAPTHRDHPIWRRACIQLGSTYIYVYIENVNIYVYIHTHIHIESYYDVTHLLNMEVHIFTYT